MLSVNIYWVLQRRGEAETHIAKGKKAFGEQWSSNSHLVCIYLSIFLKGWESLFYSLKCFDISFLLLSPLRLDACLQVVPSAAFSSHTLVPVLLITWEWPLPRCLSSVLTSRLRNSLSDVVSLKLTLKMNERVTPKEFFWLRHLLCLQKNVFI